MKFSSIIISAALATIAAAASPLPVGDILGDNSLLKRCAECTSADQHALDVIISASADHYSKIAHVRLDNLLKEMDTASVTSGNQDLPKEKALLALAVKINIDQAKKACDSETLAPLIKASINSDSNLDIPWSNKNEVEEKMVVLDVLITNIVLDRIQANVNAEILSKDCTEKMTNTVIVPATEVVAPTPHGVFETPANVPKNPAGGDDTTNATPQAPNGADGTPASGPETPFESESTAGSSDPCDDDSDSDSPVKADSVYDPSSSDNTSNGDNTDNTSTAGNTNNAGNTNAADNSNNSGNTNTNDNSNNDNGAVGQEGIDVPSTVDPKYVCKTGCKDSKRAFTVLSLRVNLEREFQPRLDHFYKEEMPTACTDERSSLLGGLLNLLSSLTLRK
ncbi:hypothetical protein BGZ94_008232 [Podila epigama]|nr:hypothetical protein BGZ94_008232 [Podila epigama]